MRVHMRYERGEKPGLGFALREIDLKQPASAETFYRFFYRSDLT